MSFVSIQQRSSENGATSGSDKYKSTHSNNSNSGNRRNSSSSSHGLDSHAALNHHSASAQLVAAPLADHKASQRNITHHIAPAQAAILASISAEKDRSIEGHGSKRIFSNSSSSSGSSSSSSSSSSSPRSLNSTNGGNALGHNDSNSNSYRSSVSSSSSNNPTSAPYSTYTRQPLFSAVFPPAAIISHSIAHEQPNAHSKEAFVKSNPSPPPSPSPYSSPSLHSSPSPDPAAPVASSAPSDASSFRPLSARPVSSHVPSPRSVHHSSSVGSLFSFLSSELMVIEWSGEASSRSAARPRQLVYNFLILPWHLEQLLIFGFLICLDCFLYLFTFLPFRIMFAVKALLCARCCRARIRTGAAHGAAVAHPPAPPLLSMRQQRDLIRGFLLIVCCYLLSQINMSRVYHYIRGQSVLKLYVIFNMLEVSDRLFCSFGEDILDALFASVSLDSPRSIVIHAFHTLISCLYIFCHSLLLFTQVITLNVSVNNSENSALFILLVSNNFVELKSAVFKRFDPHNLMQISCSDVVERFQLVVYLVVIGIQNLSHLGLVYSQEWLERAGVMCVMVLIGEMAVDWVKHGFITKFNSIAPTIYKQYSNVLCTDFIETHLAKSDSDIHSVSRRLGLPSFPVAVLVLRVLLQAMASNTSSWQMKVAMSLVLFAMLLALKLLLTIVLLGYSATQLQMLDERANNNAATAAPATGTAASNSSSTHSSEQTADQSNPAGPAHSPMPSPTQLKRTPTAHERYSAQFSPQAASTPLHTVRYTSAAAAAAAEALQPAQPGSSSSGASTSIDHSTTFGLAHHSDSRNTGSRSLTRRGSIAVPFSPTPLLSPLGADVAIHASPAQVIRALKNKSPTPSPRARAAEQQQQAILWQTGAVVVALVAEETTAKAETAMPAMPELACAVSFGPAPILSVRQLSTQSKDKESSGSSSSANDAVAAAAAAGSEFDLHEAQQEQDQVRIAGVEVKAAKQAPARAQGDTEMEAHVRTQPLQQSQQFEALAPRSELDPAQTAAPASVQAATSGSAPSFPAVTSVAALASASDPTSSAPVAEVNVSLACKIQAITVPGLTAVPLMVAVPATVVAATAPIPVGNETSVPAAEANARPSLSSPLATPTSSNSTASSASASSASSASSTVTDASDVNGSTSNPLYRELLQVERYKMVKKAIP